MSKGLFRGFSIVAAFALFAVGCNGGDGGETRTESPTPAATRTATPVASPTATPSVEQEVSEAYLRYWEVYADAVFNLDETRLGEVMTGPQLQRTQQEIENLRQRGRAAKIVVEHDFFIAELDPVAGTATVRDAYANRSYEVDAQTKEMVGQAAPGTVLTDTYFLVKEGGAWKVRDGIRQQD
ncbi:MAG: hypothetical protein QME71_02670 [Dehalococcoidia bacterium]|nr:hypothetical protein [Dehalococcoidia bacterium]